MDAVAGVGANVDKWKKIEDAFFGGKCADLFWDLSWNSPQ